MKNVIPLAIALFLPSVCSAQVVTTFKTTGVTRASAGSSKPFGSSTQSLVKGTSLKSPRTLVAAWASGSASLNVDFAESSSGIAVQLNGHSAGTKDNGSFYGWGGYQLASKLTLRSAVSGKAVVRVIWRYAYLDKASPIHVDVNLGSYGRFDYRASSSQTRGSVTKDFPITIGPKGPDIGVYFDGAATQYNPGTNTSSLRIEVVPIGCGFLQHGATCGVSLEGTCQFGGKATLAMSGVRASATGVLVIGTNQIAVPIPGSSCRLYTDPVIVHAIRTSVSGGWSLSQTLPTARPFTATVQVALFGTKLEASNGLILSVHR
jgi:hypothetical protein